MVRCRSLFVLCVCFGVAGVIASAASVPGVSASIGATATVSQPLGLVDLPVGNSIKDNSGTVIIHEYLLAPTTSGVIVQIDGLPLDCARCTPTMASGASVIDLSSAHRGASGNGLTTVTLIYTEN